MKLHKIDQKMMTEFNSHLVTCVEIKKYDCLIPKSNHDKLKFWQEKSK